MPYDMRTCQTFARLLDTAFFESVFSNVLAISWAANHHVSSSQMSSKQKENRVGFIIVSQYDLCKSFHYVHNS